MASEYQESQRTKAISLIKSNNLIFEGDPGGSMYRKAYRDFILQDSHKNLLPAIRDDAQKYFEINNISWWGGGEPTGHVLSSQIACMNHLFQIRTDYDAVLALLNTINPDLKEPLLIHTDKHPLAYIQFEAISDTDHLNEKNSTRGSNCTSIDALIYAKHSDNSKWLILIEWKYTEFYNNENKATEVVKFGNYVKEKGKERVRRYNDLIITSDQLKVKDSNCYYYEPFYQLMRQTLWAEQMIKFKHEETVKADNFMHVHVIPSENSDLLNKTYRCSGLDMETTWRFLIMDQTKYKIISPQSLMRELISNTKYLTLINYLRERYW